MFHYKTLYLIHNFYDGGDQAKEQLHINIWQLVFPIKKCGNSYYDNYTENTKCNWNIECDNLGGTVPNMALWPSKIGIWSLRYNLVYI